MREYKSLQPEEVGLYDVHIFGEEPVVSVEEKAGRIIIWYTFPGFYLSDDTREVDGEEIRFKQVNIAKTGFLGESGKPLLPSFGRYVQIPTGAGYTVTVEPSTPIQFDSLLVLPAQEKVTDSPRYGPFEYDKLFYTKDQFYPEDLVEVSGPFDFDGYTALLVHVRPLQYNPRKKKLRGYGTITVTLDIDHKEHAYRVVDSAEDKKAYGNLLLNPERGVEERIRPGERPRRGSTAPPRTSLKGPEFLIIYDDTFKKAAKMLAQWKNMRGLPTETVSIGDVGTTAQKIKSYIRQKGQYSPLQYILFFGDVDVIPPEKITGSPAGHNITDYYYSTKRDPGHNKDFVLPWLSSGRIPVETAEEATNVVNKIIAYERDPPDDPEYYTRMVFAAYFQDKRPRDGKADRAYLKTMEDIREHMITLGFDVERVYESSNPDMYEYLDGVAVPDDVKPFVVDKDTASEKLISAVSKGYLLVGHRDHGSSIGWVHPPFRTHHLDTVKGDGVSMVYSINCLTGRFDLKSGRDSLAEKLLKMKGGAPSVIAAARPSHTWLNDDLIKALFDGMWAGVLPTFPGRTASYSVKNNRLGDLLNYAKTYLPITLSGSDEFLKDHLEIYHVIGDPTLELRKGEPVQVDMKVAVNQGYLDIMLRVCPEGCVITVWHNGEVIKRMEPSSTHVRVSLRDTTLWPVSSKDISVCFWAPGCRFQQVTAEV